MFSGQECGGPSARIRLRYIDQVELRQAIEKQLNRAELANSFTRAVAVGNLRGLEHAEKNRKSPKAATASSRNCIICWNYLYLTRQVETARTPEEHNRLLRMISVHSPQSWAYFNMFGEYDFSNERPQDNTGVLPPKSVLRIIPDNWEPPIGETQAIAAQMKIPVGLSVPMCV